MAENTNTKDRIKELEDYIRDQRQLLEIKGKYILDVTAQMRTPMNVISGMIEISQNNVADSHKVTDCLIKMNEANRSIESLVEKLQDLAYLDDEIIIEEPHSVWIESIADEAVRKVTDENPNLSGRISVDCKVLHPAVLVDSRHLSMALVYVITEAVRELGASLKAVLVISEKITTDDGHGIYEILIDRPKGKSDPKKNDSRSGYESEIALTRARMIFNAMGGSLDIASFGNRNRFRATLVLPIAETAELDASDTDIDTIDFWGMRVLVAEDNILNMQVMEDPLRSRGIIVTKAWNGMEAFEAFREAGPGSFDLIILDIKMPEMDGYETASCIRALGTDDAKDVIIFTVTSEDDEQSIRKVYASGIDRYFLKPINVSEILREYIRMTE